MTNLKAIVERLRKSAKANRDGEVDWMAEEVGDMLDSIADEIEDSVEFKARDRYLEIVDILSVPYLERPDGSPCYCNPDVPNRLEDFATSTEYVVCDGESKEVFSESIAEALSAIARVQMKLGIADYRKKGE